MDAAIDFLSLKLQSVPSVLNRMVTVCGMRRVEGILGSIIRCFINKTEESTERVRDRQVQFIVRKLNARRARVRT